jgi:LmbE family N-acetylglucosaminyl deacetylase
MAPESVPRTEPLRLLAVFAHPDDETLGVGGVLARYAAEGVETHLVTATRGEGGRFRGLKEGPGHPGREKLAAIREAELNAAASVLGIRSVTMLGYQDGRLDQADPREATSRIADVIRRLRPQVVITFPPDGGYGHPDHIAICQLATAGVVAAASSSSASHAPEAPSVQAPTAGPSHAVSKLYYFVSSGPYMQAYQAAFKKLTSLVDGVEREAQAWPDWMITTVIDTRAHWERVQRAVDCHDSQVAAYEALRKLGPEHREALWGRKEFYRVLSLVNGGRARETDLFEGIR